MLKYGSGKTYPYELDLERLNYLADKVNICNAQVLWMFQLVDGDYEKLKILLMQLKNCHCDFVPGYKEKVEEVMKKTPKTIFFKFD